MNQQSPEAEPPVEAGQPSAPVRPADRLGIRIAATLACLLVAVGVVLGSLAILDWWDRRQADAPQTAASEATREPQRDSDVFVARGGHFEADFPKKPARSVLRLPVGGARLKTVMYISEQKRRAFVVGMTNVPRRDVSLRGAAEGAAAGSNAQLLRTRKTRHQGYDAITYTARATGPPRFVIRGLIVRTDKRMFQASVLARTSPDGAYRDFIDSFRIR